MDLMLTNKPHISLPPPLPFTLPKLKNTTSHSNFRIDQEHPPQKLSDLPSNYEQINLENTKKTHAQMLRTHFYDNHLSHFHWFRPHSSPAAQLNFLITSYIKNDRPKEALKIYAHMRKTDTYVDNFTVPSVLKACGHLSWTHLGKEIHGFALKNGLDWDIFIHNALIQMYTECANIESASQVFDKMPERDVVSWSTMIRSYSRNKYYNEALDLTKEMHYLQIKPSEVAMINIVNLFADLGVLEMGRPMHAYVIKNSKSGAINGPIGTALIDMYAKCGSITSAQRLFERLTQKSIVSWTAMIAGYIRCNNLKEAEILFVGMREDNIFPNEITMLSLILECGFAGELELGKRLHGYILRNGLNITIPLATALVDMYGKCGEITSAKILFDSIEKRDVMTWTAMISAYAQAKCLDQAFNLFLQMGNAGIKPNEVTMVNLIMLCAEAGALDLGKWVHAYIDKERVRLDIVLSTALIDMYAKCGDIEGACRIFDAASDRDICMWNAMIGGLAMHGRGEEALELFYEMERIRINPNDITLIGVLHACSHAGLVIEGREIFHRMVHGFGLSPRIEHYGCMVDLLGRAGMLDEAYEMIMNMPFSPNIIVWGALLAACKLHKNPELGELAARRVLELEPHNCGYNILMSNIYAASNRWNDVAEVRKVMKDAGIKKEPGLTTIEVNGSVHKFVMGDQRHLKTREIHEMLDEMYKKLKEKGYVANASSVLQNINEEEKETALSYHSEKLAMAFGLISTAPGTPIRIVKNLRVCDDCHSATKLLSKIYGRVIIVRDRSRFHHFSEGLCSCGDYW